MKKLILSILSILFILCLSFQASAWVPTAVLSGTSGGAASDPCSSPVGTYEWVWTGEHATASDYACLNSGGSSDQGTDVAGVITSGGLISGTYEATLDANNENIVWTTMPSNIVTLSDTNGFIRLKFKTPADITHTANQMIFQFRYNGDDQILIWLAANQTQLWGSRNGSASVDHVNTTGIAINKTYEVVYTWDVTNNEHTIIACDDGDCSDAEIATCAAGSCDNDGETLDVSANNYTSIEVGDAAWTNDFVMIIDDIVIGTGYIGP